MKTIKILTITIVLALVANITMATSAKSLAAAKQQLNESIGETIQDDISKRGNFLYENDIVKLNDRVKVSFRVNDNSEVELLRVDCKNCDAKAYLKDLFSSNKMKADEILVGKAYSLDVYLKFKAK